MLHLEQALKTSLQDVLKTFLQDVLKTFGRRLENVLARRLEDVLKTSSRRLEEVLKTSRRRFCKTSWKRLEGVWPRRIYWSWSRRLEDVLKASSENVWVRWIYSSWSRRLEEVLETSSEDEDERRLQDVCWGVFLFTNINVKRMHDLSFSMMKVSCFIESGWYYFILFCLGYLDLAFRWRGLPLPYVNFRVIKASATKFCNYTHYYACLQFFLKYLFVMPSAFFWRC